MCAAWLACGRLNAVQAQRTERQAQQVPSTCSARPDRARLSWPAEREPEGCVLKPHQDLPGSDYVCAPLSRSFLHGHVSTVQGLTERQLDHRHDGVPGGGSGLRDPLDKDVRPVVWPPLGKALYRANV